MTVALITGANSGIGRATAIDLAAHGYDVYASMRDLASGAKLAGLASEAGVEVRPVQLDVANDESVTAAVTHVVEHAGRIDVLVNNAGVGFNATTEDVDIDAAKKVFETNFWGALRCTKAVLPHMRAQSAGHVVQISSIAGRIGAIGQTIYSASKWALESMSENLAQEVAQFGIRISVIEPGVCRTAILPKNTEHPQPTAYDFAYRRLFQFYAAGIRVAPGPEVVAEAIRHAIETEEPQLRYTCGWAGPELAEGRKRMSDREWIEIGAAEADGEYYELFEAGFGVDISPK